MARTRFGFRTSPIVGQRIDVGGVGWNYGTSPVGQDGATARTFMALFTPHGSGSLNNGQIWGRDSSGTRGTRFLFQDAPAPGGNFQLGIACTTGQCVALTDATTWPILTGNWYWIVATTDGTSVTHASINLYGSVNGSSLQTITHKGTSTDGTGSQNNDSGISLGVGSRVVSSDRSLLGSLAWIAIWAGVKSLNECEQIRTSRWPGSSPNNLIFFEYGNGGIDYGRFSNYPTAPAVLGPADPVPEYLLPQCAGFVPVPSVSSAVATGSPTVIGVFG
jgi:hypothetical protein